MKIQARSLATRREVKVICFYPLKDANNSLQPSVSAKAIKHYQLLFHAYNILPDFSYSLFPTIQFSKASFYIAWIPCLILLWELPQRLLLCICLLNSYQEIKEPALIRKDIYLKEREMVWGICLLFFQSLFKEKIIKILGVWSYCFCLKKPQQTQLTQEYMPYIWKELTLPL